MGRAWGGSNVDAFKHALGSNPINGPRHQSLQKYSRHDPGWYPLGMRDSLVEPNVSVCTDSIVVLAFAKRPGGRRNRRHSLLSQFTDSGTSSRFDHGDHWSDLFSGAWLVSSKRGVVVLGGDGDFDDRWGNRRSCGGS